MNNPCIKCIHAKRSGSQYVCLNIKRCEAYNEYERYKESKRKYKQGRRIYSLAEFERHFPDGFFYLNGVIKHVSILQSMSVKTIMNFLSNGSIRTAIKKDGEGNENNDF